MISVYIEGFLTGASLIIAIGAQNAFVLKQGLLCSHVFTIALLSALIDAGFISFGVIGLGYLFTSSDVLMLVARYGGALFLFIYGLRSFRAIFKNEVLHLQKKGRPLSRTAAITATLALTFLNPHAYLDAFVLLGSIGGQFEELERPIFALGAITASFVWFFSLAYGARFLAPLFQRPIAWKILDGFIACVMWSLALMLVLYEDIAG